jgi:hypothetical protein
MDRASKVDGTYVYDAEGNYLILHKFEYEDLWKAYDKAQRDLIEIKRAYDSLVEGRNDYHTAFRPLYDKIEELNVKVRNLKTKNEELMEEKSLLQKESADAAEVYDLRRKLQEEESMNFHLKRIAKERANQKRGIKNKKKHDGYLVLLSQQHEEHWTEEVDMAEWRRRNPNKSNKLYSKIEHHFDTTWKTIIQTPYDASIPFNTVETVIMKALWSDDPDEMGLIQEMGCTHRVSDSSNGKFWYFLTEDDEDPVECVWYSWNFSANFKSGFWEVIILTDNALNVAEDRYVPK